MREIVKIANYAVVVFPVNRNDSDVNLLQYVPPLQDIPYYTWYRFVVQVGSLLKLVIPQSCMYSYTHECFFPSCYFLSHIFTTICLEQDSNLHVSAFSLVV